MRVVEVLTHPAIESLVQSSRDPERLHRRATTLVQWLLGSGEAPHAKRDPWLSPILSRAQSDFDVVRLLCKGRPLRALAAGAALLVDLHVEVPPDEGPEKDDAADDPDDDSESRDDRDGEDDAEESEASGDGDGDDDDDGDNEPDLDGPDDNVLGGTDLLDADGLLGAAQAPEAAYFLGAGRRQGIEGALDAAQECAQLEETLGALLPAHGWDYTSGTLERMLLGKFGLFERLLSGSRNLGHLADLLGRMERSERQGPAITGFGKEQVVGVRLGGDLQDVLPSQWALLGDPDTEDLFYQRFAEHRLMTLDLRGDEDDEEDAAQGRGPIIACVDTSGSMQGDPESLAKALVLCVARRALKQRRAVHVMLFGGRNDLIHLQLRGGARGLDQLLDFLLGSFHAGTDFDGPLMAALDLLDEPAFARADMLVVTDGLCRADPGVIAACLEARVRTGLSITSAVVAGPYGAELSGVEPFSDRVFIVEPQHVNADPVIQVVG